MTPVIEVHHRMFTPGLLGALAAAGIDGIGGEALPAWSPEQSIRGHGIDAAVLSVPVPMQFVESPERVALVRSMKRRCAVGRPVADRFGSFATLPAARCRCRGRRSSLRAR